MATITLTALDQGIRDAHEALRDVTRNRRWIHRSTIWDGIHAVTLAATAKRLARDPSRRQWAFDAADRAAREVDRPDATSAATDPKEAANAAAAVALAALTMRIESMKRWEAP